MSGGVNKVIVIGNLGRDAELRYTQGGAAVASFSVATTETWKDRNGDKQERTEWVRAVLWGKTAESVSQFLVKGKQVYLEGRLQTSEYEKNGQRHYSTEVVVQRIVLLGGGGGRSSARDAAEEEDEVPY